tara:strand:- start:3489 stop:4175 length:687 start_codon:yes stop_codon:yes gene_type:complete
MSTRFPNGITTTKTGVLRDFILPSPLTAHVYFNDFDTYLAGEWTITTTEAGAGSATEALGDIDGGALVITNAAGDNDNDFLNKVGESFSFTSGKKAWFATRLKLDEVLQSDLVVGLQITDTSPLAVTDGVFFLKADGAATVDLLVEKNSTATTSSSVATMVADTFIELAFHYDGKDNIQYFVDGAMAGNSVTTNLPDDEVLTVSFGVQNGEAVAKVLTVDYILAAKER